ncbi:SMI1/KNR4 family protein [Pendulispora rubella]|uniref:SMI1/KNR4 family protein n=1 Tax=Pendulispora rubella TaxID=2741070 RepID=A0ABZ2L5V6_9BACT
MTALSHLEIRLIDNFDDEAAWAMYAGELAARGDVRAKLIAGSGDAEAIFQANAADWLNVPNFDPADRDPGLYFEWKYGFVLRVVVDLRPHVLKWPPLREMFRAFLDGAAAHLLRRVEFRRLEQNTEGDDYVEQLAARGRPSLRELVLRNVCALHPLDLPSLRELSVHSESLSATAMRHLSQSHMPELERLRMTFGNSDALPPKQRPTAENVAAALGNLGHLRELTLHQLSFGDELLARIPETAAATHLEVLDLSSVELTPRGAGALGANASGLPRLRALALDSPTLSAIPASAFGALETKVTISRPSSERVARYTIALAAEHVAARTKGNGGATQESVRAALRIQQWAHFQFSDELADAGTWNTAAGLEILLWSLGMANLDESIDRLPMERSPQSFIRAAQLRDRAELEALHRQTADDVWTGWCAFENVSRLRERLRALGWILGAAKTWDAVPVHVGRHKLPAAEAASSKLSTRVQRAWNKLKKRFRHRLPEGVSEASVDAAEREIGFRLPADLRTSFLLHGAGSYPLYEGIGANGGAKLLSLREALSCWRLYDDAIDKKKPPKEFGPPDSSLRTMHRASWRRAWLPVTDDPNDSDFHAVDLEPAADGSKGQVFFWSHELGGPECVMNPSFVDWLEWATTAEAFDPGD